MILTYTSLSDVVDPLRNGLQQTLTLKPYQFPVPTRNRTGTITHAYDRGKHVYRRRNRFRSGSVVCRQIPSTLIPYLDEFLESVDGGQDFDIDPEGWQGHDASYTAILVGDRHEFPHDGRLLHTFSFEFEVV